MAARTYIVRLMDQAHPEEVSADDWSQDGDFVVFWRTAPEGGKLLRAAAFPKAKVTNIRLKEEGS